MVPHLQGLSLFLWTCDRDTVEENINKGSTVAVMRVFDLLLA